LVAQRVRAGSIKGERRSTKRGTAVEFADYRPYARGDDLRRVDWNVYARLERPFVKLLEEEEDLAVHLLLDSSGSMDWGQEPVHKFRYGLRLVGALAYIGLGTGDRVTVQLVGTGDARHSAVAHRARFGPVRGTGQIFRLLAWLAQQSAGGVTDLNAALRTFSQHGARPGLVMLLTDLWSPTGFQDGVRALLAGGHEVAILHLLAPDELEPPFSGDLKLVDTETGDAQDVTLDRPLAELYRRRLDDWLHGIEGWCHGRQVHYVPVCTDLPWERLILHTLRKKSVIR